MAARRQLGRLLLDARKAARLTQEEAAEHIGRNAGTMHKIENGKPGVKIRPAVEIRLLCEAYDVTDPEVINNLRTLAVATQVKGPYQPYKDLVDPKFDIYLGLEGDAVKMASYDDKLVHGLLQTEAYARAMTALPGRDGRVRDAEEINKRVQLRLERQELLTRSENPLEADIILSEAVLRLVTGDPEVMRAQLHHINEVGKLPNVTVRVVPVSAGLHLGYTTGQFNILRFPGDQPPFVFSDGYLGGNYFKEEEEIARYDEAFADISRHALDPEDSRAFIENAAKEIPPT